MATAAPTDGWAALEELAELSRMVHGGRRSVAQGAEQEEEDDEDDEEAAVPFMPSDSSDEEESGRSDAATPPRRAATDVRGHESYCGLRFGSQCDCGPRGGSKTDGSRVNHQLGTGLRHDHRGGRPRHELQRRRERRTGGRHSAAELHP